MDSSPPLLRSPAPQSSPPPCGAQPPRPLRLPFILKPTPPAYFTDFGTNAEMRWASVDPQRYLTPQSRLFVRNHTRTPQVDRSTYALRVYGDGLATPRGEGEALSLSFADLQRLPHHELTAVVECTGNGRSYFRTQQGQTVSGTAWTLGAVGTVRWSGVRLRDVLASVGLSPDAVSIQATGLDDPFVSGGTDYGRVRRPFPVEKALDDALLAWGINGEDLLPDHGYPLRLVLPGWVGIASIKWLGSLEVSTTQLTSPWNTTFYRMVGPDWPADSPPLTVNPVRSAWELAPDAGAAVAARHPDRSVVERRRPDHARLGEPRRRCQLAPRRPGPPVPRGRGLDAVVGALGQPAPRAPRAARPGDRRAGPHPAARGRLQHPGLLLRRRRAPPRAGRLTACGDGETVRPSRRRPAGRSPGRPARPRRRSVG